MVIVNGVSIRAVVSYLRKRMVEVWLFKNTESLLNHNAIVVGVWKTVIVQL